MPTMAERVTRLEVETECLPALREQVQSLRLSAAYSRGVRRAIAAILGVCSLNGLLLLAQLLAPILSR